MAGESFKDMMDKRMAKSESISGVPTYTRGIGITPIRTPTVFLDMGKTAGPPTRVHDAVQGSSTKKVEMHPIKGGM